MRDKIIACAQCENEFVFTKAEQEYYQKMGFDEPKRCADCRRHKLKSESYTSHKPGRNKRKFHRDADEEDF